MMHRLTVAAALCVLSFTASSRDFTGNATAANLAVADEKVQQVALDRELALQSALVRSPADLSNYVRGFSRNNAFTALEPKSRQRFLASLTFNEHGLTGFSYAELEQRLTATQVFRILALFGQQHATGMIRNLRVNTELDEQIMTSFGSQPKVDYPDFKCAARATCEQMTRSICLSTCAGHDP